MTITVEETLIFPAPAKPSSVMKYIAAAPQVHFSSSYLTNLCLLDDLGHFHIELCVDYGHCNESSSIIFFTRASVVYG